MKQLALLPIFALLACSVLTTGKGMKVTYQVEVENQGKVREMKTRYYIQGDSVRSETAIPEQPNRSAVIITKDGANKAWIFYPPEKVYLEISRNTLAEKTKKVSANQIPFQSTKNTRSIAGYTCQVFERKVGARKEEACVSAELADAFSQLRESISGSPSNLAGIPAGLQGFPLEYAVSTKATKKMAATDMRMRVTSLEKETQMSFDLFQVPKGYRKQKIGKAAPKK